MSGEGQQAWTVGEPCFVDAFGKLYRGEVTKVGRKRVTVQYTTGTGATRTKAVGPMMIFGPDEPAVLGLRRFDYRHLKDQMEWCRIRGRHISREGHACCEEEK